MKATNQTCFVIWCDKKNLSLSIEQTYGLVVDFRKQKLGEWDGHQHGAVLRIPETVSGQYAELVDQHISNIQQ